MWKSYKSKLFGDTMYYMIADGVELRVYKTGRKCLWYVQTEEGPAIREFLAEGRTRSLVSAKAAAQAKAAALTSDRASSPALHESARP
ncbi:MAG: hypothetical protein ABL901_09940 [Hyphomicrobiaceae bacterium]